jgi:S-adenosylmethionine hydrolase
VIDLAHGIPPGDVRAGAIVLRSAMAHVPAGVHLAVVDPGVGGARAAVALRACPPGEPERLLVGPDNGLLLPAAEALGGVREAVDIGASRERLEHVSRTFHGRDVFAPVAAALAAGETLADVGDAIGPEALVRLELLVAVVREDGVAAHVVHGDRFGNVILDASAAQLREAGIVPGAAVAIRTARGADAAHEACYCDTFADVEQGGLLVYVDGIAMIALAVNGGSARERLGLERDDELLLAPA